MKAGVGKVKSLFDDADINISVRDEDVLTDLDYKHKLKQV